MTLFSYEIFDTVAHQGSFNKAAQQLHLTPSAISHAIAVMEQELGFSLFARSKYGVTLTPNGEALYPAARAVLNSDEALRQIVAELNGLQKGRVRIGIFNSACTCLLPEILKSFSVQYPQIEVEVMQGTYDDVLAWMRTGTVDIGFLSESAAKDYPFEPLLRDPLRCIVPKGFPMPQGGVMTPETMRGQRFVIQGESTDADIQNYLQKYKIHARSHCRVVDDMSNIAMVKAGIGIAIMPELLLRDGDLGVDIYPLAPQEYRTIGIAVQESAARAPAVEQMRRHIIDCCAGREAAPAESVETV